MTIFLILWAAFVIFHLVFTWGRAWHKGQQARQRASLPTRHPTTAQGADVTIIIPAWNDASVLGRTLRAVYQEVQSYPHRVQVLIVAGGKDQCFEKAQSLRHSLIPPEADWTVLLQQPKGKNAALNQALSVASYPNFIFLDADTEVQKGWLAAIVQPLITGEAAASAGFFEGYNRTPVSSIFELDQVVAQLIEKQNILFGGGSIAMTKETLETLGGKLPEEVVVGVDWDLSERVGKAGLPRRFAATAKVRTELPQTWADYWKTEVRWRRAFYKVELRHFQTDQKLVRLFGLFYVPTVQALVLVGWVLFPVLSYLIAGQLAQGFLFWLLFCLWILGRHASSCLKAYRFTGESRWLRLIPTYLWSFCVSAGATWKALFTLKNLSPHFKGRRAEVSS